MERQTHTAYSREPHELVKFGLQVYGIASKMYEKILNHGCHCSLLKPGLESENIEMLGGIAPVDELDQLCREWSTKRKCLEFESCDNTKLGGYNYNFSYDSTLLNYKCNSVENNCERFFCEVDIIYLQKISEFARQHFQNFEPLHGNECIRKPPTIGDKRCCMRTLRVYEIEEHVVLGPDFENILLGVTGNSTGINSTETILPDVPVVNMNSGCPSGYFYEKFEESWYFDGDVDAEDENVEEKDEDLFGIDYNYNGQDVNIVMGR